MHKQTLDSINESISFYQGHILTKMWFLPSQLGKLCADVHKNYTFTLKSVNDRMIRCKAGVLCTQCLFWNRSKPPRKNVWHTFNRGENMHKNARLPIAYHVIGHPVAVMVFEITCYLCPNLQRAITPKEFFFKFHQVIYSLSALSWASLKPLAVIVFEISWLQNFIMNL